MNGTHPSDEALQQYVLDPTACAPGEIDHIGSCPACREAAAAYRMLADTLKEQPAPAFDFDLAAAVIAQLEAPHQPKRKEGAVLTAVLIAVVIAVPGWLFRKSAYFVFTDMSAQFYWMLLATAGIVVGLFLLRLHKKYQNVINLINK
jgi:predicted anti-sigma-YlaC factor YlaD